MSVYLVHIISIMVIILLLVYAYLDWIVVNLQNSRYVCDVGNRVIRYWEECKAVIVNVNAFFIIWKKHYIHITVVLQRPENNVAQHLLNFSSRTSVKKYLMQTR